MVRFNLHKRMSVPNTEDKNTSFLHKDIENKEVLPFRLAKPAYVHLHCASRKHTQPHVVARHTYCKQQWRTREDKTNNNELQTNIE